MRITHLSRTQENIAPMTGSSSLSGIWRLARIKMKVRLLIVYCLIISILAGFGIGAIWDRYLAPDTSAPDNLDYLIDSMEVARESHQDIVDNPERYCNWLKAGIDHRIWVENYEDILEILRDLK